jgi:hypothetical protein
MNSSAKPCEGRAVVSKRGVDDGNQKGGGFLQPAQESQHHYNTLFSNVKKNLHFFEIFYLMYYLSFAIIFCFFSPLILIFQKKPPGIFDKYQISG